MDFPRSSLVLFKRFPLDFFFYSLIFIRIFPFCFSPPLFLSLTAPLSLSFPSPYYCYYSAFLLYFCNYFSPVEFWFSSPGFSFFGCFCFPCAFPQGWFFLVVIPPSPPPSAPLKTVELECEGGREEL